MLTSNQIIFFSSLIFFIVLSIFKSTDGGNKGPYPENVKSHQVTKNETWLDFSYRSNFACEDWKKSGKNAQKFLRENVRERDYGIERPDWNDEEIMRHMIFYRFVVYHCCVGGFNNCTTGEANILFQMYLPGTASYPDNKSCLIHHNALLLTVIIIILQAASFLYFTSSINI